MARSRQITTKTPSPAATIIVSTSLCVSAEQFNCLNLVDKSLFSHSRSRPAHPGTARPLPGIRDRISETAGQSTSGSAGRRRAPQQPQDSAGEPLFVSRLASAAASWAFTGGAPLFADWQVRRASPRLTLGP
jgi:hypothetical protein